VQSLSQDDKGDDCLNNGFYKYGAHPKPTARVPFANTSAEPKQRS